MWTFATSNALLHSCALFLSHRWTELLTAAHENKARDRKPSPRGDDSDEDEDSKSRSRGERHRKRNSNKRRRTEPQLAQQHRDRKPSPRGDDSDEDEDRKPSTRKERYSKRNKNIRYSNICTTEPQLFQQHAESTVSSLISSNCNPKMVANQITGRVVDISKMEDHVGATRPLCFEDLGLSVPQNFSWGVAVVDKATN